MKLKVLSVIAGVLVGAAALWPVESHAMGGFHGGMGGGGFRGGMMGGGFRGGMMGNRVLFFHGGNFNRGMMAGRSFPDNSLPPSALSLLPPEALCLLPP
jgi:hypothetical protein